ncbi:restriction endonuclease subunit S [Candidatus Mycoplasma haematobovis]|uniref:restriction endonuclease subunit S n=1 Tax=Candidatus Mycoplasma haematobovis TaxID=432608 RepID=UPI00164F524C|nr:restriction endonuclease subunit S [Candidatus Mycoplasma haematobovis]
MSDIQYLTIKDICDLQAGYGFESHKYKENGEPILRVTSLKNNKIDDTQLKFFYPSDYSKNLEKHILRPNEIVISKDGTIGKVAFNNKNCNFYLSSQLIKVIPKTNIHTRYLFHFLISKTKEIEKMTTGKSAILHLNLTKFKNLKIPIPTLEKQKEIANKLDKFSKLSEELQEELSLRKKQYEYYRDELLSFKQDNKIEWLTLGEIETDIYRGSPITKSQLANSGKPCLKYGEIYTTHKIWFNKCISYLGETNLKSYRYCEYGDLLFAIDGETPEEIGTCVTYLGKEKLIIDTHIVVIKHKQNPKYLAYALSTFDAQKQKIKLSNINQIVGINKEKLKKIKIPIPSLEKQQEISNLLDKFWKLSNNIKEGLPAEILLRKHQYEYYRDKLLK